MLLEAGWVGAGGVRTLYTELECLNWSVWWRPRTLCNLSARECCGRRCLSHAALALWSPPPPALRQAAAVPAVRCAARSLLPSALNSALCSALFWHCRSGFSLPLCHFVFDVFCKRFLIPAVVGRRVSDLLDTECSRQRYHIAHPGLHEKTVSSGVNLWKATCVVWRCTIFCTRDSSLWSWAVTYHRWVVSITFCMMSLIRFVCVREFGIEISFIWQVEKFVSKVYNSPPPPPPPPPAIPFVMSAI